MTVSSYLLPFSATLSSGTRYVITGTKSVEQGRVEWYLFCFQPEIQEHTKHSKQVNCHGGENNSLNSNFHFVMLVYSLSLWKKIDNDVYLWHTQKQVSLFSCRFYTTVAHHQQEPDSLYSSNKRHKLNITWMKFYIHATVKTNTNSYDKKGKWTEVTLKNPCGS
jgi:hypothetical protein